MKIIFRLCLLAVICIVFLGIGYPTQAQSTPGEFTEVDTYITETMRRLPIQGLALAVVKGDQILYLHGYGTANAQGDPATPQTPWLMGSVTKSFTALAIRQLDNAGKVNLDTPVQTYLPEFRLADPYAASHITLRDLLNHTSGISKLEGEAPYLNSPTATFDENLDHLAEYRTVNPPGTTSEYSNWNYVLLGEVIDRVSDQTYAEYVRQNIFAPLGMSHSTFADYHSLPHAVTGNLIAFGLPVPYDEAYIPAMLGAGYLTSTAEDMAHYLSLFFSQEQVRGGSLLPAQGQGSYMPMWNWNSSRLTPDMVYGLSGGLNSISTSCLLYPQQEVGVVLLLNTRLDQLPTGISAYEIARGIGNIINQFPYEIPSNRGFYLSWVVVDGLFILFIAGILWQVIRLNNWRNRYQASGSAAKALAWAGTILDLLTCAGILYFPTAVNSEWDSILFLRPDFGYPLLIIGLCLGFFGILKMVLSFRQPFLLYSS